MGSLRGMRTSPINKRSHSASFMVCVVAMYLLSVVESEMISCFFDTQDMVLLQTSCPCTTYPTFSYPPTDHPSSPSTTSSPLWTDIGIYPHSSPDLHSLERNPVPIIDASSCFTSFVDDPLRSSTGPSVRWSPFSPSYVFLFGLRSCSASTTQHRPPFRFSFDTSYDSLSRILIGSAMWQPTLNLT